MTALKNHPGLWLRSDAAASLARFENDHGVISVNSAGRTEAYQQSLIDRWFKGGKYNRPPYLYEPKRPASASAHVKDGGIAIDTNSISKMLKYGRAYGWVQTYSWDKPHFEYNPNLDQKRGGSSAKSEDTRKRQQWLNKSRNAKLKVDGIQGRATTAAIKAYQKFLKASYGYKGAIDGIWGKATQAAHQKYYNKYNTPKKPAAVSSKIPSGLKWNGIQEMLRKYYGYRGLIDNIPGKGTITAFQKFLNAQGHAAGTVDGIWGAKTAKAAQRWLKARWGYKGAIDGIFGGGTKAAWKRAEVANGKAF